MRSVLLLFCYPEKSSPVLAEKVYYSIFTNAKSSTAYFSSSFP